MKHQTDHQSSFVLLITASPSACSTSHCALRFARAVLNKGDKIHSVFFYAEGVQHGNALAIAPEDTLNYVKQWAELSGQGQFPLHVCIASALKRGVLDDNEATRYDKPAASLAPAFRLSGLGQLIEAQLHTDRCITFKE